MSQKSEFAKMSESVTKRIVDNVNNVLGILPQPLSFEFNRPKKRVHHRKAKASHRRPSTARKATAKAKRAGVRLKKRAKSALTSARKSAAARKARHPRKQRTAKVIPLRARKNRQSHSRAA